MRIDQSYFICLGKIIMRIVLNTRKKRKIPWFYSVRYCFFDIQSQATLMEKILILLSYLLLARLLQILSILKENKKMKELSYTGWNIYCNQNKINSWYINTPRYRINKHLYIKKLVNELTIRQKFALEIFIRFWAYTNLEMKNVQANSYRNFCKNSPTTNS